jgi:uncharacterized membrane protein
MFTYFTYHYRLVNKNKITDEKITEGEKFSENVAVQATKWFLIVFQLLFVGAWILWNSFETGYIFDPFPFVILWLILFSEILFLLQIHMINITLLKKRLTIAYDHDFYAQQKLEHEHKQFQDHLNTQDVILLRLLELENRNDLVSEKRMIEK